VGADIVMHPSSIVADRIRVLLATPLLTEFEKRARMQKDAWACQLASRIVALVHDTVPEVWEVSLDEQNAYAVCEVANRGDIVTIASLLRDPRDREKDLPAIPLMLAHNKDRELLPDGDRRLRPGDRVLLCGRSSARSRMGWTLQNAHSLDYVLTGGSPPGGAVWRWISSLTTERGRAERVGD
jgi:hypothetical protein